MVDIGYKSEGAIDVDEFSPADDLSIGREIEVENSAPVHVGQGLAPDAEIAGLHSMLSAPGSHGGEHLRTGAAFDAVAAGRDLLGARALGKRLDQAGNVEMEGAVEGHGIGGARDKRRERSARAQSTVRNDRDLIG